MSMKILLLGSCLVFGPGLVAAIIAQLIGVKLSRNEAMA